MVERRQTGRIALAVGYDHKVFPGEIVLVLRDEAGIEYGIRFPKDQMHRAITLGISALSEPEPQDRQPLGKAAIPSFPQYSLSNCVMMQTEQGAPLLAMTMDGVIKIGLPLSEQEALLLMASAQQVLAHHKARKGTEGQSH